MYIAITFVIVVSLSLGSASASASACECCFNHTFDFMAADPVMERAVKEYNRDDRRRKIEERKDKQHADCVFHAKWRADDALKDTFGNVETTTKCVTVLTFISMLAMLYTCRDVSPVRFLLAQIATMMVSIAILTCNHLVCGYVKYNTWIRFFDHCDGKQSWGK
jgi:hypothetical protein